MEGEAYQGTDGFKTPLRSLGPQESALSSHSNIWQTVGSTFRKPRAQLEIAAVGECRAANHNESDIPTIPPPLDEPKSRFRVPVSLHSLEPTASLASGDTTQSSKPPSHVTDDDDGDGSSSLSSVPTFPNDLDGRDILSSIFCPMCGAVVDPGSELAAELKNLVGSVRNQTRFCARHRRRDAESQWALKGYPLIEWAALPRRLTDLKEDVAIILKDPSRSFFRRELSNQVRDGKDRTLLMQLKSNGLARISPGYYGPRGLKIM